MRRSRADRSKSNSAGRSWTSRFADLLAAHALADFVLQTDRQAHYKAGGLGSDACSRRALGSHVGIYTLACSGVLAGVARRRGPVTALLTAGAIAIPHAVIDDRRLMARWMRQVKKVDVVPAPANLALLLDQGVHVISLWAVARVLGDD